MEKSISQRREQHESATDAVENCMWFLFPNVIQNGCNVGTNTAINVNATDNTATKAAASESSEPNDVQRIGAPRHQRARGGSLNERSWFVL
jgi:hypothetical protein